MTVDCFELYHDMQMVRRRRQTACARQRLAKSIVRHSPLSPYATAPVASVADPKAFRSGWDFSAWIRLVLAVADLRSAKSLFTKVQSWSFGVLPTFWTITRVSLMNHTDTRCDCDPAAASPLALRWRCPVCGKTTIMKMSTLAAVCDGDIIRKVEPEVLLDSSGPAS